MNLHTISRFYLHSMHGIVFLYLHVPYTYVMVLRHRGTLRFLDQPFEKLDSKLVVA